MMKTGSFQIMDVWYNDVSYVLSKWLDSNPTKRITLFQLVPSFIYKERFYIYGIFTETEE